MPFSVIVCTHNPDEKIFNRLLNTLRTYHSSPVEHEIIIVDNNSSPALKHHQNIQSFLSANSNTSKLVEEKRPGLTNARLAGINAAVNDWIIFFDDDNEPADDYLEKATEVIQEFPDVAAWGPGIVEVEYTGTENNEWLQKIKPVFQQKYFEKTTMDNNHAWQDCYPYGTGLVIKTEVAREYAANVVQKKYSLSDRRGKSLASGGDAQLVLCAVKIGYQAGVSPALKMNHLIKKEKTKFGHVLRIIYGTVSAYVQAYNQVFSDAPLLTGSVSNKKVLLRIYSFFRINFGMYKDKREFMMKLTTAMGELKAAVNAAGNKTPASLYFFEKLIAYK